MEFVIALKIIMETIVKSQLVVIYHLTVHWCVLVEEIARTTTIVLVNQDILELPVLFIFATELLTLHQQFALVLEHVLIQIFAIAKSTLMDLFVKFQFVTGSKEIPYLFVVLMGPVFRQIFAFAMRITMVIVVK